MTSQAPGGGVQIELLGAFSVVVDGCEVAADEWPGRRAVELVQLLALPDAHRLTRDQVIEGLWPTLGVEAGAANLRKAAHHARQALRSPEGVELRGGQVALFPSRAIETDAARFEAEARAALAGGDAAACAAAASGYSGVLLPEARYEEWTHAPRERLRSLCVELLRRSGQWERLVELEPTDEPAYRELMRSELAAGSRPAAIRWYGRLRHALRQELRIVPGAESEAIYDECVAELETTEPALVGRQLELARATALLRSEPGGDLGVLVVRGSAGIGKTAFCREVAQLARAAGWMVAGVAVTDAGGPYAPLARVAEQLEASDPTPLQALGTRARAVMDELTSPAAPQEQPLTRHQVIGAFRRLLLAAGEGAPVALIVDDAHLADEATIDVLNHLGSAGGTPIVPVLAYRPESAPEALTLGVARLARAGKAAETDLGPLDREDATALVAAGASVPRATEVVDRIVELAQGNPFLTLELARSATAGVPALVPTARDAIASRLVDLEEGAVATLRRLALAGDDLDPAGVVALIDAPEAEAFALLDVALSAGVLVVFDARYRFRHDLVRQALVEQLTPHERLTAHGETARRLATADAEPGLIARHWLAGGRPDEAREWLLAAARRAVEL
nr:AAA family ATPase [Thermoleophilaceae bacterium]